MRTTRLTLSLLALSLLSPGCGTEPDIRDMTLRQWRASNEDSLRALLSEKERAALRYGIEAAGDTAAAGATSVGELLRRGERIRARVAGEHSNEN